MNRPSSITKRKSFREIDRPASPGLFDVNAICNTESPCEHLILESRQSALCLERTQIEGRSMRGFWAQVVVPRFFRLRISTAFLLLIDPQVSGARRLAIQDHFKNEGPEALVPLNAVTKLREDAHARKPFNPAGQLTLP